MHYACKDLIILCLVETHLPLDLSTQKDRLELLEIYVSVTLELEPLEHIHDSIYVLVLGSATHNSIVRFQESIRITQTHFI